MEILSTGLGYIMRFCYQICHDYALAIFLFTLVTKVILFPVSVWVHKNSLKLIRMQPEVNRIKTKYFGFGDQISEQQAELYKREKYNPFAGILPLIIQLILLMGLVNVIYNPLTHIFHLDRGLIEELIRLTGELTHADISSSSIQMTVVDAIKNPMLNSSYFALSNSEWIGSLPAILGEIQQTRMNLLGYSMALIPTQAMGITLLMPVMAGGSAWLMCIAQNHWNPLQAEQGKLNQYGMMAVSVFLSLFLGAFVPLGVGFYWILSNILAIAQQLLLNALMDPRKYIDYEDLEKSKKELQTLENLGGTQRPFLQDENTKREKEDYKRFFSIANKHLVFYSEGSGFYKYYKAIIEYLLKHSNVIIHYITSDPSDEILKNNNSQIKAYYIGPKKLITLMMKMDADLVVMTMPDLNQFHIKRSYIRDDIEYIYIPHGMDSLNMTMRKGSMDHYDTIFCVGPHQKEEIEKTEAVYGLPSKRLVEWGYGLLDDMKTEFEKNTVQKKLEKQIIIAPSWQDGNIVESCLEEILSLLDGKGYQITVRPHPQHIRHYPEKMNLLKEKYSFSTNIKIQTDFSSNSTVFEADLLITDWSGIAYEFAYTTNRPVLFINTPMKVMNPEYQKIDTIPLNIILREEIGRSLDLECISDITDSVSYLMENQELYSKKIKEFVGHCVYNLGKSGEVGARYIVQSLLNRKTKRP